MKKIFSYLTFTLIIFFILSDLNTGYAFAQDLNNMEITADKAITIDIQTNEIIYAKNADEKAQPASTTKLMTAALLSLNKNASDMLSITNTALNQPSSSIYKDYSLNLSSGDLISADNVMKGLLLHSGNDMATIIAEAISGNVDNFANLMNEKAIELNMHNTHFSTPSGLDTEEALNGKEHYTTAYDLSLLGQYAFSNPWVLNAASTTTANLDINDENSITLTNGNKNLNKNGCLAGKTGFTTKAGRCLVALYERNGRQILGVILGSTSDDYFNDMEKIIDYSYEVKPSILYKNGETVDTEDLEFKLFKFFGPKITYNIPFILKEDVYQYFNDINALESKISLNADVNLWNLSKDSVIGTLTIQERNATKTFNIYTNITTKDLIKKNIVIYLICLSIILFIFLFVIIKIIRKKSTKKHNISV